MADATKNTDNIAKAEEVAKAGTVTDAPAPKETKLDDTNTQPATTVPGDAPFDTVDPLERASTVLPMPDEKALAEGTVNGVRVLPNGRQHPGRGRGVATAPGQAKQPKHRIEKYKATKPDGTEVEVEHNLDTGETKLV